MIGDTMVMFCKMNREMPMDGFKGFVKIKGFKVLVFDKYDFSFMFYNQDSLQTINLNSLSFPAGDSYCCTFVVKDGILYVWGVQPDDFSPIRIEKLVEH